MDRARKFLRVSSSHQSESKQIDDVERYIAEQRYTDDGKAYIASGKSAYTGKHLAVLNEAFEDMARGEYDVLVLWDSSRFTRMGAGSAFELMSRARQAGGRLEYAAPHAQQLNVASDWSPVMLALQATADKLESDRKRQHTLRDIAKHQASGSVHGKPGWGFKVVGSKDNKRFEPTAEGRRWIPWIYEQVIAGRGATWIARKLTAEGVGNRRWNEGTLNRLIRNPMNRGVRRNGGNLQTEALVTRATWQEAIAALESRAAGGRTASKHAPSLLIPICAACYGVERDGSNGISRMYLWRYPDGLKVFRCTGSGPQRKGCGVRMVPAEALEAIVLARFSTHLQHHYERVFIPGTDIEEALKDIGRKIAEAAAMGRFDEVTELNEAAKALSQQQSTRPHFDFKGSGITRGQYFSALNRDQQREYLKEHMILAEYDGTRIMVGEVIRTDDGGRVIDRWV